MPPRKSTDLRLVARSSAHRLLLISLGLALVSACSGDNGSKKTTGTGNNVGAAGAGTSGGNAGSGGASGNTAGSGGSGGTQDAGATDDAGSQPGTTCATNADCDDQLFCSGSEVCDTATSTCKPAGDAPCAGQLCQESSKSCTTPSTSGAITLDANTKFQTIGGGWEATAQAGHDPDDGGANYAAFQNQLIDLAVNDLGLTRIRLEVRSGVENAGGNGYGYPIVNDNADPNSTNLSAFNFSRVDLAVNKIVLPMKKALEDRGEKLHLSVCYVSFLDDPNPTPSLHAENPAEYAEFVLTTYKHLKDTFGLDVDTWEVILEPDNVSAWTGQRIGDAIAAAASVLESNGFSPSFVAPSAMDMDKSVTLYDQMIQVNGVLDVLHELSYHRYGGVSDAALNGIRDRSIRDGVGAAMLEHIAADYNELHRDLSTGRNTSWQQFTLAYPGTNDSGAKYYGIDQTDPANPKVVPGSRTKFLRQYFKYIRPGATRFDASSNVGTFEPLAFENKNGKVVVVVKANGAGSFSIASLPDGQYGIKYTTQAEYDVDRPDQGVFNGQVLATEIPAPGVITIYGK